MEDKRIIICIGGGEIGRPGTEIETEKIDLRIKELTGKENPKLLFIPTASNDSLGYCSVVKSYFGEKLGFVVDELLLIERDRDLNIIKDKIYSSDVVYVGGGNTKKMIELWKQLGVDKILFDAWHKGIILSGLSAGMNCFFEKAVTDSDIISGSSTNLAIMNSLGFIKGCVCPHFDVEKNREAFIMQKIASDELKLVIALENKTALEIHGDNFFTIIKSDEKSQVYIINKENKKILLLDKEYKFNNLLSYNQIIL